MPRVTFLYLELEKNNQNLNTKGSSIQVFTWRTFSIFKQIVNNHGIVKFILTETMSHMLSNRDLKNMHC